MSQTVFWTIFLALLITAVGLGIWIKTMWGSRRHRHRPRHRADRAYRQAYRRASPIKPVGRWRWGWPGDYRRAVRVEREVRQLINYSCNK